MHYVNADGRVASTRSVPAAVSILPPMGRSGGFLEMVGRPDGPRSFATYRDVWLSNPWLYVAINLRARGLSRIALDAHRLDADGNPERLIPFAAPSPGRPDAGQSLARLLQRPMYRCSRQTWLRRLWLDRQVYGNSVAVYREPDASQTVIPEAFRWVPWNLIQVIPDMSGDLDGAVVEYVEMSPRGKKIKRHAPENLIHFGRSNDPYSPVGESAIQSLKYTMALFDAVQRHLVSFFKNAARPSGYMQVQPGTRTDKLKEIREEIGRLYAGPENAGKPMVTSAEWKSITTDPKSSAIIELLHLSREEIAAAYHIPPPIMGILDRAIKSNVAELRSFHLRDVVGPDADEFEGDLHAQCIWDVPQWNGLTARFNLNAPLRPDLEARATVYGQMRHVWTPNEMRRMEGEAPLTGVAGQYADTTWMPSGEVALGLVQPQTQAETYGILPTDADGVANLAPEPAPAVAAPDPAPGNNGATAGEPE